jgi:hypothetical protein
MKPRTGLLALALPALALALLAAACGGGGSGGSTGPADEPATPPDAVLVDVRTGVGAFTPLEIAIENRPEFRLYGDGTVVVRGPDGGALPLPTTYVLSQEGIDAVLDAAADAGLLGEAPDYGMPPVTDVGSTTVALDVDGATVVHDAYALGFENASLDGLTDEQRNAREALAGFVELVKGLADERPDLIAAAPGPYQPEAVDVHVWRAPEDADPAGAIEWPLGTAPEAFPPDAALSDARCATVRGADLAALLQALGGAEGPVLLRSGDALWSAGYHVVLPGEEPCSDDAA